MTTRLPVRDFVLDLDDPRETFARKAQAVGQAAAQLEREIEARDPVFAKQLAAVQRRRSDLEFGAGALVPRLRS